MKRRNLLKALFTILFLFYPVINAICQNDSINNGGFAQIDSLIEKQIIDQNCILIRFGADAITALNTEKGIVIIDAGISTELTSRYRKIIEDEFKRNDFVYVINTHGHLDHIGGNSVFPEARIFGHKNCLQELSDQLKNKEARISNLKRIVKEYDSQLKTQIRGSEKWNEIFTQATRYRTALNDALNLAPVNSPVHTFEDSMRLDLGDYTIEMYFFGKGHSESDILISFPQMKLLFIGDIFAINGRPGFDIKKAKDKKRRLKAIQWARRRKPNIETIIDGHGEILSIDDFDKFDDFFEK